MPGEAEPFPDKSNLVEVQKPTIDPLAPVDPRVTTESDQWLLDRALEERRAHIQAKRQRSPGSRGRLLGGASALRSFALRGEIEDLRDRIEQSKTSTEGEVVDEDKEK